jgi:hypothetical protein
MTAQHTLARPPKNTPKFYETEGKGKDALVFAHYFLPSTKVDIYVLEYSPEDDCIFGYSILNDPILGEYGYTSLKEMEEVEVQVSVIINGETHLMPVRMELDEHWKIKPMRDALCDQE